MNLELAAEYARDSFITAITAISLMKLHGRHEFPAEG